MGRKWKPQPVGALLTKLAGSGRGPAPTPLVFRSALDGAVEYERLDGGTGRASYWAQNGWSGAWGVDLERRVYVALVLEVEASAGTVRKHVGRWDTARGVAWKVRECEPPAPPLWASA